MGRKAEAIVLSPEERDNLDAWARGKRLAQRLVQRARIIRMAADGVQSQEIARQLRLSRPTVQLWRAAIFGAARAGLGAGCAPAGPDPRDLGPQD